jgi:hypothetical protein
LTQYIRDARGYQALTTDVTAFERPPMATVADYATTRTGKG